VCDGVIPGNEGRGYVLRRIARRAMRHGYKLDQHEPFFYKLVPDLVKEMGGAYPELAAAQERITGTLKQEEERFAETLETGMGILESALRANAKRLDGETAFKLYDTYGFPVDLTADIGRERGFEIDMEGFNAAMSAQQERSRAGSKFKQGGSLEYSGAKTSFRGYETLSEEAHVVALYREGAKVDRLGAGEEGVVVLDRTPFYAESGGQVGDRGELTKGGTCLTLFEVRDTQKLQPEVFGHYGTVKTGELAVGDTLAAQVDLDKRGRTMRHHSATHLMHKALREVLGHHVQQKGSLVDEFKTRFDFSHNAPLTADEIRRIESLVNAEILRNEATNARVMPIADAQKMGAMMLFGEKYGDEVRVLDIGTSRELCGGTHVARTGDIGPFRIVSEGGVAAGIRRIEAVAGTVALALAQEESDRLARLAEQLKSPGAGSGSEARADAREREVAREGSREAQGKDGGEPGRQPRRFRRRRERREGARREARRRRREAVARRHGPAEGQAQERRHRSRGGRRRQGEPHRRRDLRSRRQGKGGRARELRRHAGGRQGRGPSRHGPGGRDQRGGVARGARVREGVGRAAPLGEVFHG
jgi:alanyl-tRNA synthetase